MPHARILALAAFAVLAFAPAAPQAQVSREECRDPARCPPQQPQRENTPQANQPQARTTSAGPGANLGAAAAASDVPAAGDAPGQLGGGGRGGTGAAAGRGDGGGGGGLGGGGAGGAGGDGGGRGGGGGGRR